MEDLEVRLSKLETSVASIERRLAGQAKAAPEIADDTDLDGPFGDPKIVKDPPRWTGESCAGLTYSQCPPDYLQNLAKFLDWQAKKDEESGATTKNNVPRAGFKRRDAARARGWAARISRQAARKAPTIPAADEDDIPF